MKIRDAYLPKFGNLFGKLSRGGGISDQQNCVADFVGYFEGKNDGSECDEGHLG